ncbi:MAG: LysR substrate-binding domain-containing protein [Comamonas sp.]
MLCAAPSYLAKHPAPNVLSHQCITTTELQPWTFQTGQQERTQRVAGRLTINCFEDIHAACMPSAGIALLSSWYTAEYLQSGRLVAIALEDAPPK